jgi:glycogen debranching enzyme
MPKPHKATQRQKAKDPQLSPRQRQERRERVLTQGEASVVRSIADAVVIKDEDVFFLCKPDGRVPAEGEHGYGLYANDCRFLNGYELHLAGARPNDLVATAHEGFRAVFQLTNPDLHLEDGTLIPKERVSIKWERVIDAEHAALEDVLTFRNFGLAPIELPVSFTFRAEFDDVFAVRGLLPERFGKLHRPRWRDGVLLFRYDGSDGYHRSTAIHFSEAPSATDGTTAHFRLSIRPGESRPLILALDLAETRAADAADPPWHPPPDIRHVEAVCRRSAAEWLSEHTAVTSDSPLLDRVLDRSLRDLRALHSRLHGHEYFAAGVPWFVTLFGRDSLITALQMLAYDPRTAADTLRLLARLQGERVDEWRDEQPGKILHEYRDGEMARTGQIPHTPYYGSVDATPLFLILLAEHARWTGTLTLFEELRGHVERALVWIDRYGDADGDGYVEYASRSTNGLVNQGWKDSGNAIVNAEGRLADPPIALVEVQGYVYRARQAVAELYRRAGDTARADELERAAAALRERFNRDFWLDELGCYVLALQGDKRPCAVASSNPGHALWAGIADPDKARRTVDRLLAPDLFNGWGVRTLSEHARGYNPLGYHLGTVWPHDNAFIAAGFRRYGFDAEALTVFRGILGAATYFAHYRLPELFAGFSREEYGVPVRYPVACHPQAWAAGTAPYLVTTLLGLEPDAFAHRLHIVRPVLPPTVDWLELRRLRVGRGQADLRFERRGEGPAAVRVLHVEGGLDVVAEPGA